MKPRHALALALLVVWCLSVRGGGTVPKDCANCGIGYGDYLTVVCVFKTKADCEAARDNAVRDFHANAEKNGERVASPPSMAVCGQRQTAPK